MSRSHPEVVAAALGVLMTMVRSKAGCNSVLNNDLNTLLWLPLSDMSQASKDWIPVFCLALHSASTLLRVGGQSALDTSVSLIALLQDQLVSFLLSLGDTVQAKQIELTAATASFVSRLFGYYKQWQLLHSASLGNFYCAMARLLHICISLLIRPSVLKMLIGQDKAKEVSEDMLDVEYLEKVQRARRMSTASGSVSSDSQNPGSEDWLTPEAAGIKNKLLDIISSCLNMHFYLSPNLTSLLTNDVTDFDAYEVLLQIGFSTPTFEQV